MELQRLAVTWIRSVLFYRSFRSVQLTIRQATELYFIAGLLNLWMSYAHAWVSFQTLLVEGDVRFWNHDLLFRLCQERWYVDNASILACNQFLVTFDRGLSQRFLILKHYWQAFSILFQLFGITFVKHLCQWLDFRWYSGLHLTTSALSTGFLKFLAHFRMPDASIEKIEVFSDLLEFFLEFGNAILALPGFSQKWLDHLLVHFV